MFTHPGGKLLFMGNEFGTTQEWNYKSELPWELLQFEPHKGLQTCVKDLCFLLREQPAMYEEQFHTHGFEWIDLNHRPESVIVYRRKGTDPKNDLLVILNMTPEVRHDWKVQVYGKEIWQEIFNSNDKKYWGTGDVFNPEILVTELDKNSALFEINVQLPPLGAIVLR